MMLGERGRIYAQYKPSSSVARWSQDTHRRRTKNRLNAAEHNLLDLEGSDQQLVD